ncbi:hypothetical protein AV649_15795 [Rossellomorea marisflavi]|uniref:Uncharacterized protein n=1 Tax=Rossellomorea marisflavi TaxID=189381 RepID=A0A165L2R8_9BACI|nr:hypothetical protein AV649_15795 [Rossellomorea marisflavi]
MGGHWNEEITSFRAASFFTEWMQPDEVGKRSIRQTQRRRMQKRLQPMKNQRKIKGTTRIRRRKAIRQPRMILQRTEA